MTRARAALLACALASQAAHAKEVWNDRQGALLDVQAFAKTFLTAVALPPALVEGTQALASTVDQARGLLPPALGAQVPQVTPLPEAAGLSAHVVRVAGTFKYTDRVRFEAAWQGSLLFASDPSFSGGASLSGAVAGASAVAGARRRLVEASGVLVDKPGVRLEHQLDRLALTLALPFGDLTVGRQVLSWGTGRLWNPTDVLSPFPPTVVDREVRRGFDAVRLALALGDVTQLDLLYLPQEELWANGGVARLQTNVRAWDVSVSAGKYAGDLVFGADVVGDVGPLGVHAEGAYTVGLEGLDGAKPVAVGEHFLRGVVGVDWRPREELVLMAEYHFNGFGAAQVADYAKKLTDPRVRRGEVFGAGQHYAGVAGSWRFSDLLNVGLSALVNLQDPSAMLIPSFEYSFEQTVLLRGGAFVPLGAPPDARVFTVLEPGDVLGNTRALQRARDTLGLASEYGASSFGAFVQVGVYVP